MKKIWMFLLGAAFAAELFLLVCMASRSASPRQVIGSKEVGNLRIVYLDFLEDGQAVCPSFFVY